MSRHRRPRWFVCAVICGALALMWCMCLRRTETTLSLKVRMRPDALMHFLADFTNEPAMDDRLVSWSLAEESRAGGVWQYVVHHEGGAGVWGEVRVRLTQHNTITHERSNCHAHIILGTVCWKEECMMRVEGDAVGGGGAVYSERCAVQCGWEWCGAHAKRREARAARMVSLLRDTQMLT